MANSNFVVQNGLTIGPLTIDATTGSISTTGNITTTGTTTTFINEIVTGTEAVYGVLTANAGVASTSTTTGTFIVTGGAGISGALYAGTINTTYSNPTNLATANAVITGGSVNSTAIGGTTPAAGNFTTLQGTNFSTGNAVITGGSLSGITNLSSTTSVATNFSTGNAVITGGSTTGMTSGSFTTLQGTNLSSANVSVSGAIVPTTGNAVNLGSTTNWFNNIYGTAIHSLYADLAENYVSDKPYPAGTVLMFGGEKEVTVADVDTSAVAGIVSTNPSHLMNGGLTGANIVPLALTGRVPCMIIGPVKKGDLLVSAGYGYAKASSTPGMGTVVGKSLVDFPSASKATIEVAVGRY